MSKKIIASIILCSSFLLISGCSLNKISEAEPVTGAEEDINLEVVEAEGISEQEMKQFFTIFLNIDHESLLLLNQRPQGIDDEYWRVYQAYQSEVNKILGEYLASSAKEKLNKQYLHDDFHFPRLVQLNDYMVTGIDQVSDVIITSKRVKDTSVVYEVEVIGIADVIDFKWASKKYKWNHDKGYYIQEISMQSGDNAKEPGQDSIRVAMAYLVEVPNGEEFTVASVREKTGLHLSMDEHGHVNNNRFIKRLSFIETVIKQDEEVIHEFIDKFLKEDYNFYHYYRKAYDTDYDTFRLVLEYDLGLTDIVALTEDYKAQFGPSIIPLKDNMESLHFQTIKDVTVIPHVSSSAKQSTYQVFVNADVTLISGMVLPYEYTYLFTLDQEGKVTSVRLLTHRELDKDALDLEDEEL